MSTSNNKTGSFGRALIPYFTDESMNINEELTLPENIKQKQQKLIVPKDRKVREFTEEGYFRYKDMSLEDIDIDSNVTNYIHETDEEEKAKRTTFEKKKEGKIKKKIPEKKQKKTGNQSNNLNFFQNFHQQMTKDDQDDEENFLQQDSKLISPQSFLTGNFSAPPRQSPQNSKLMKLQSFLLGGMEEVENYNTNFMNQSNPNFNVTIFDSQQIENDLLFSSPFSKQNKVKFVEYKTPMKPNNHQLEDFQSPSNFQETFINGGNLNLKTPAPNGNGFTEEDLLKTLEKGKKPKYFAGGMWHQAPDPSSLPIPNFE
eukprot:gene11680-4915_t